MAQEVAILVVRMPALLRAALHEVAWQKRITDSEFTRQVLEKAILDDPTGRALVTGEEQPFGAPLRVGRPAKPKASPS